MRKNIFKVVSILLVMCILLTFMSACGSHRNEGKTETQDTAADKGPLIDIIKDGKTDYVIVYNSSDSLGKTIAMEFADTLYSLCKVSIPVKMDTMEFEKEILIGNTVRGESVEAMMSLNADTMDFYIGNKGDRIVMCANGANAYKRMLITFESLCYDVEAMTVSIAERESYQRSTAMDGVDLGECLKLAENGKTSFAIIYPEDSFEDRMIAKYLQKAFEEYTSAKIEMYVDYEKYSDNMDYEIVVGGAKIPARTEANRILKLVNKNASDFILTADASKLYLIGGGIDGLVTGTQYVIENLFATAKDGSVSFYEGEEYRHMLSGTPFSINDTARKDIYKNVLKKLSTRYEYYLQSAVSTSGASDQKKVSALIERLGDSAVFYIGSSSVLNKGYVRKLDENDYSRVANVDGLNVMIPAPFANSYFGTSYHESTDVNVMELAEAKDMITFFDVSSGLVIVSPSSIPDFSEDSEFHNGYSNLEFRKRMIEFFNNDQLPEPENNTEQSRVVIDDRGQYPDNAVDYTVQQYKCLYSPSIMTVEKASGTVLYTSYEVCTVCNEAEFDTFTCVRMSDDGGLTWRELTTLQSLKFAELFALGDDVYIMGYNTSVSGTQIARLNDDGTVDSTTTTAFGTSDIFGHAIIDGILYVPFNQRVLSIPTDKDPLNVDNWTVTANTTGDLISSDWFNANSGLAITMSNVIPLEGLIVEAPDGTVCAVYRIECHPYPNTVAVLKLSEDRQTLSYYNTAKESLVTMPTTISRFSMQYDEASGYYILISNWYTIDDPNSMFRARNVLGISVSRDLRNWTQVDTLLVDREMMNSECSAWKNAYQYPDFDFDGDDIVMIIREATGNTSNFHDGTYMTFFRISNFRDMLPE